eukprot:TRINITY_DN466_c5_g1_i1.p1 TRINITY_DN466_c5_g1~~TRINITY_DN466_c5_g1_i1.p1  ORF type:complete len:714 (-),score=198.04 TRINITY_DN466_c5_g1_i1:330-2471(-)
MPETRPKRGVSRSYGKPAAQQQASTHDHVPLPVHVLGSNEQQQPDPSSPNAKSTPAAHQDTATRRKSLLIMSPRAVPQQSSVVPSSTSSFSSVGGGSSISLDLPEDAKEKLDAFLEKIGVPLGEIFAKEAIDLDVMLAWDNPEAELRDIGIHQKGVIFRVVKGLEKLKIENNMKSDLTVNTTMSSAPTTPIKSQSMNSNPSSPYTTSQSLPTTPRTTSTPSARQRRSSVALTAPPVIPEGPSIELRVAFPQGRIYPLPKAQGWGGLITGSIDPYVKCDVRLDNQKLCRFRTQAASATFKPSWMVQTSDNRVVAPNFNMTIPEGWFLWFEIWDQGSFGDTKLAEGSWDWSFIQTLRNGSYWIPLKFMGLPSGELEVEISGIQEQDLEYQWSEDKVLGSEFETMTFPLQRDHVGPLTTTLIRKISNNNPDSVTAVLFLHSFSDYFFEEELARNFTQEGYHFYALDLRRYGRSMQKGGKPNHSVNLIEYYEELHLATNFMRKVDGIKNLLLLGHGLGGLIATLFAGDHPEGISALCLNCPLFALNKNWEEFATKSRGWFGGKADADVNDPSFSRLYHESLNAEFNGEWRWDINLKPIDGFPVYARWIDTIKESLKRLPSIKIEVPVYVLLSTNAIVAKKWSDDMKRADMMIAPEITANISQKLSRCVKVQPVKDAVHNVFLSKKVVRDEAFDLMCEYFVWLIDSEFPSPMEQGADP